MPQWGFTDAAGRSHQFIDNEEPSAERIQATMNQANAQAPATRADMDRVCDLLSQILRELRMVRSGAEISRSLTKT